MANREKPRSDADLIEIKKWGVPNWKKPDGYPKWEGLNSSQQRWEFLRRTKEYRNDWDRLKERKNLPTSQKPNKFARIFDKKAIASKYSISEAVSPKYNHTKLPSTFAFDEQPLSGGEIIYPRLPKAKQPTKEQEEKLSWDKKLAIYADISSPKPVIPNGYDLRVWIEFDLSRSLDDQREQAEINLSKAKKQAQKFMEGLKNDNGVYAPYDYVPLEVGKRKSRIPTGNPYIELLRIFDAKNSKCTNKQISTRLAELNYSAFDESTISKKYKTAKNLWKIL